MSDIKIGLLSTSTNAYFDMFPGLKQRLRNIVKNVIIKNINIFGEIIYPGLVYDMDSAKKAEKDFLLHDVDVVIIVELAYTTSEIAWAAIKNTHKPIVVLSTQLVKSIDSDFQFEELLSGNCLVGDSELTCVLKKFGIDYRIYSGRMDKSSTYEKVGYFLKALDIVKKIKNLNIGFIGGTPYPGMIDIRVDEAIFNDKFGAKITHIQMDDVVKIFNSIKQAEIEECKREISAKYKTISITSSQYDISVRMVACLKKVVQEYCLGSLAMYDLPIMNNPELGICPCFAATILNTNGIPVTAEGDIPVAISMFIMNELAGNTVIAEHYILNYENNSVLMGHAGIGNLHYSRNDDDVKIKPHTLRKGIRGVSAYAEFSAKEGRVTLLNISPDRSGAWKGVIASGNCIYADLVEGLQMPQLWFKPDMDLDTFNQAWCLAGASHHSAVSYGEMEEILVNIGMLLKLNTSVIK